MQAAGTRMDELILRFAVALSIGLLVGLERGWRERDEPAGSRTAGIRTYGISGLLGGIIAALADSYNAPYVLAVGFIGFALPFAWFQAKEAAHEHSFSVTSVVAGLCVFALGALAVSGDFRVAAAGGAALAGILASREVLHGLLKRLSWIELRSALVLAIMTTIVLPLLPDRTVDPWNGLNPREVWLFTILMAGISYMGYVAARVLGPARGFLVSGLAGALVSSTAVTVAFARAARQMENTRPLSGGAALAAMVSILRVLGVVLILGPGLVVSMGVPALAAAATFCMCGLLLVARAKPSAEAAGEPRNPFELAPLLIFALAFAIVSMASAAMVGQFGGASLVATSAISGIFDVDVAVLSALRLHDGHVGLQTIGDAVLAALLANALGRLVLAISVGPPAYWLSLAGATALAAIAGAIAYFAAPILL